MNLCEFEEKEFEGPLYNQLEKSTNLLWQPGQCFEEYIGIDRCIFIDNLSLFKHLGINFIPNGACLPYYDWSFIWRKRRNRKTLPNFKLNLFVQAKRPYYGKAPKKLSSYKFGPKCYKFNITDHQQVALEKVSNMLKERALIVYASPMFCSNKELYIHTKKESIIDNTTFPEITRLTGHNSWYYNKKINGIAHSEPLFHEVPNIFESLESFYIKQYNSTEISSNIESLRDLIYKSFDSEHTNVTAEEAYLFEKRQQLDNYLKYYILEDDEYSKTKSYLEILLFTMIYNLDWFVVGRESI